MVNELVTVEFKRQESTVVPDWALKTENFIFVDWQQPRSVCLSAKPNWTEQYSVLGWSAGDMGIFV